MKITYKTRGGSSPQGKPRVWYTGHPAETGVFAGDIFADIFKTQNCAIYYDAEPNAAYDEDELLRELSQMQLFIIPITKRFLYQPSRAREVEFAYAASHHIPVLPLQQEPGLEGIFNDICGDLQILNKHDTDPTARPYAEKLENFLESVLVGDELAAKVRAAFDAYVFLSYRKKDRRYAQELMRLIHKNDFCRDIAIWYDEFLTPGENFNDAIAEALQKCSLFTLAVTPNIVEPGNYVMALEYPAAKKSGKPILPVELAPTDRAALESSFEDIPPCTDAQNNTALSDALLDTVQQLALRQNNTDPQHNFFIGLAYLGGIDTEVDRERALTLITGAAEDGLPEAMQKLVDMYHNGNGVARDYYAAVSWQEKLAAAYQAWYEKTRSAEDVMALAFALWNLGNYRHELGELNAAQAAYERMNEICVTFYQKKNTQFALNLLLPSYENLGRLYIEQGDFPKAKTLYQSYIELCEDIWKDTGSALARWSLSAAYKNLGHLWKEENDLSEAKRLYQQSLALDEQMVQEAGAANARSLLAGSYDGLGSLLEKEGELAGAKRYCQRAFALRKQLYEEEKTPDAMRDLMVSYIHQAYLCRDEGNFAEAQEHLQQSLVLATQLLEDTGLIQARNDLAIVTGNLSWLCRKTNDPDRAMEYALQSLEQYRQIFDAIGSDEAKSNLALAYDKLSTLYFAKGNKSGAEAACLEAHRLLRQLADETRRSTECRSLVSVCRRLALLCKNKKDYAAARMYFLEGQQLCRQLWEKTYAPEDGEQLADYYEDLAELCKKQEDQDAARNYYDAAIDVAGQMWQAGHDIRYAGRLIELCQVTAFMVAFQGEEYHMQAIPYCDKATEIYETLPEEKLTASMRNDAATCYYYRAYYLHGELVPRMQSLLTARKIWKKLSEEDPGNFHYTVWLTLSESLQKQYTEELLGES